MKNDLKSIRNLIVPIIVFVVLMAAFLLARFMIPKESTETTAFLQNGFHTLISLEPKDIQSVSVEKGGNTAFIITRKQAETNDIRWRIDDPSGKYDPEYFSEDQIARYISLITNVSSDREISVINDLWSEYGLDHPSIVLTYRLFSGDVNQIEIGSKTPDGESYYVRLNPGKQQVLYILPAETTDVFNVSLLDFFNKSVLNHAGDQVDKLQFKRSSNELSIVASPGENHSCAEEISGWQLSEPVVYASSEIFDHLAYSALTLEIDAFIEDSTETKAQYGLSDPVYQFGVLRSDGTWIRYYLSQEMGGKYYGYSDAIQGIFYISSQRISGLDASILDYYYPFAANEPASSVKTIEVVFPEGKFYIEMSFPDGMSIDNPDVITNLNHRSAKVTDRSGQSYFMMLFDSIMSIRMSGIDTDRISGGETAVSIRIIDNDGRVTLMEFRPGENNYYLYIDGVYSGFSVSPGELYSESMDDPGVFVAYDLVNEALDGQINGKYDIPES